MINDPLSVVNNNNSAFAFVYIFASLPDLRYSIFERQIVNMQLFSLNKTAHLYLITFRTKRMSSENSLLDKSKLAAFILLDLFINERHLSPWRMGGTLFSKQNILQSKITEKT